MIRVFMSVGQTSTPLQQAFVEELECYLRSRDLDARTVGRNRFRNKNALNQIKQELATAAGVVVVAFERRVVATGIEYSGLTEPAKDLQNERYPTIWNQIEAGMAAALGHPLLVIAEDSLVQEGLLQNRFEWYVQFVTLDPGLTTRDEFLGVFEDWYDDVLDKAYRYFTSPEPTRSSISAALLRNDGIS